MIEIDEFIYGVLIGLVLILFGVLASVVMDEQIYDPNFQVSEGKIYTNCNIYWGNNHVSMICSYDNMRIYRLFDSNKVYLEKRFPNYKLLNQHKTPKK